MKSGTVRNYERMPLGKVVRTYGGRPVEWIARCPKCGRRGARSVFIPEESARRGGSKPNLSVSHKATYQDAGFVHYWAIDDHCFVRLMPENIDELLNLEERTEYLGWMERAIKSDGQSS